MKTRMESDSILEKFEVDKFETSISCLSKQMSNI